MFSVAPNIVLVPNMTQNAERRTQTQDARHKHCSYPASRKSNRFLQWILMTVMHEERLEKRGITNYIGHNTNTITSYMAKCV